MRAAKRALGVLLALGACACEEERATAETPERQETTVQLCDGETHTKIPADAPRNRETAERVSRELMSQWRARHPEREWADDPDPAHAIVPSHDNSELIATGTNQGTGHTYGAISALDVRTWSRETDRFVAEGDRVFHDAEALGSTIGVSCDMCHPHAANTHPETYPKFQVQLGRVALLRDMINWCLEHPVRAPRMEADDPRMRAMEAYLYGQRHGVPLDHGRR